MKHCVLLMLLLGAFNSLGQDLENDRLALVALFNTTGGPLWFSQQHSGPKYGDEYGAWIVPGNPGDNPCGWYGITCTGGRVTDIRLTNNKLRGVIPAEIGNLSALKTLELAAMRALSSSDPALTGALPLTFANLSNLESLDLQHNAFEKANFNVIFTLTRLKHLSFSAFWPVPATIGNLSDLEDLTIRGATTNEGVFGDSDIGSIPAEIGNLTKLNNLLITNTRFSGPIPDQIGNLINLQDLSISHVNEAGPIPATIRNLINLRGLTLAENGHTGTIPASFNALTKIRWMVFVSNRLSGTIPRLPGIKSLSVSVSGNNYDFDAFEPDVRPFANYSSQRRLPIVKSQGKLSVNAGGTIVNNTYKWYHNGAVVETKTGDNTLTLAEPDGYYQVEVTNSQAPGLTLFSDTYQNALPVNLISFTAQPRPDRNSLTWITTSETNNKGFEIERSANARTFTTIGFVDGNGDANESKTYHYSDSHPFDITYYRLKQLDYDGKFEHSKIIMVKQEGSTISIYPNPAQKQLTVSGLRDRKHVFIYNQKGAIVSEQVSDVKGNLDTGGLPNGIYNVRIDNQTKKLLIQK